MTDHRAIDLSYGHLGEASYDLDKKSWYFSREIDLGELHQVEGFNRCSQLSLRVLHSAFTTAATMYAALFTGPSKLDHDSFESTLCTNQMASEDPA